MTSIAIQRFLDPDRNVGGGDLVTRVLSTIVLLCLVGIVVPQSHVPFPLVKIALLIAAELGLVGLMLALFLQSKTYFIGVQLFPAGLVMLWLAGHQLAYVAALVGLLFVAGGIVEIVTRRSRLNGLLGVNSFRNTHVAATLLEVALSPEVPEPDPSHPPAPMAHGEGEAK